MNFTKLSLPKHIKNQISNRQNGKNDLQICTRLPPEPSGGGLHLGHLFAARLNQSVATVHNGKFLIRFDDTNPSSESKEYEQAILEDLIDCGFDMSNVSYTSDSFNFLIDKATELVKLGWAYVDNSTHEDISIQRKNLTGSKCRDQSVEENLELWNGMLNCNKISGFNKKFILRLKAYPDSKNGAMRDPILYRYVDEIHYRTGNKYTIYPTYDFACPILDSSDGVTHVFRSKEYVERDEQMKFILNKLNMRIPKVLTYGRINVENSELSKRKIKEGIRLGIYSGWDDKKLFTYRGMKNRGISLSAINKLLDDIGFPETSITIQQQKIFTINTKIIDKFAHRIIAIKNENQKIINLELDQNEKEKIIYNFTGNKDLGERKCVISKKIILDKTEVDLIEDSEEITLINIGNVIYHKPNILQPYFEGNPSTTSKKVLWLNPSHITSVKLEMLDGTLESYVIESHIENIKVDEYVCVNKIGYFYAKQNKPTDNENSKEIILVKI